MKTLIGFKRVVFAAVAAMGLVANTAVAGITVTSAPEDKIGTVEPAYGALANPVAGTEYAFSAETDDVRQLAATYAFAGWKILKKNGTGEYECVRDSSGPLGEGEDASHVKLVYGEGDDIKVEWQWSVKLRRLSALYTMEDADGNQIRRSEVSMLSDGNTTSCLADSNPNALCILDLGDEHPVKMVSIAVRHYYGQQRCANLKIAGSKDKVTWSEPFVALTSQEQLLPNCGINYFPLTEEQVGNYRYVKFYNFSNNTGNICEIAAYSDDLMASTKQAQVYDGTVLGDGADLADGVKVTGTLVNAPAGSAQLIAYAARKDYGIDADAWVANAAATADLGTVAEGQSASATFTGLDTGRWYWQMFIVSGTTKVAVPRADLGMFSLGTRGGIGAEGRLPVAYVSKESLKEKYDGSLKNNNEIDGWMILDLGSDMGDQHLDSLRTWPRKDNYGYTRTMGATVDFGYVAGDAEAVWAGKTLVTEAGVGGATRTVYKVDGMPEGVSWKTDVLPGNLAFPYGENSPYGLFTYDTVKAKPRYVKIAIAKFNVFEIEARFADDPNDVAVLTVAGDPAGYGTPSVNYGVGKLPAGDEVTVTMAQTSLDSADTWQTYSLLGWTLTRVDAKGTSTETVSTPETLSACTFTPQQGEKITLTWHWKSYGRIPAKIFPAYSKENFGYAQQAYSSAPWMIEDGDTSTYPAADQSNWQMGWDFGTVRKISFVRYAPRTAKPSRCANARAWGSVDGVTWEKFFDQGGATMPTGFTTLVLDEPQSYRYVFLECPNEWFSMSEWQMFSEEMMLNAYEPVLWSADNLCNAPLPEQGVKVSGVLTYAPALKADITVYAAKKDYGDDVAAWKAHAAATAEIGEKLDGTTYVGYLDVKSAGKYYWRAFATAGGKTTASSPTLPFHYGTMIYRPQAYSTETADLCYDGNGNDGQDLKGCLVFDLKGIPAGWRLATIRLWPRNWSGSYARVGAGTVKFGYATGEVAWDVTKVIRDTTSDYPVSTVSTENPENLRWGAMTEVGGPIMEYVRNNQRTVEYEVRGKTHVLKPDYLYFTCGSMNAGDVELRLERMPGMAIIVR